MSAIRCSGVEIEIVMEALDQHLGDAGFSLPNRSCGLDIDDIRILHVNQMVGAIGEDGRSAP